MLTELRIRNLAIIESVNLPLQSGLNVLSGETGAGKSIIVGALELLLGERASSEMIRTGAEKATVEGSFDIGDDEGLRALADARGIEVEEGLLVLRREVSSSGRGRAWVNGSSVTAGVLSEIGRRLVDLHGQHDAQTLLDTESQRTMLDAFAGAEKQAAEVRVAFEDLSDIRRERAKLQSRRSDAEKRAEYLRHVAKEIEDARLQPGEDALLEREGRLLENADELRTLASLLSDLLSGDETGALQQLAAARKAVGSIHRIDSGAANLQEMLDSALYTLEELSRAADDYSASVDLDPDRLEIVRRRREVIYGLTRKYGPSLDDVIEMGRSSRSELDLIDTAQVDLTALSAREEKAGTRLASAAGALASLRAAASRKLAKAVAPLLSELGMPDGKFAVALQNREEINAAGSEDVEFRVALNVGHEERPLARVASGGELSRVMLALKTVLARLDRIPTLVFDEVDAGIGGKVGLQVGDTLRRVAEDHQVFVISHLPQIAARAHHHIVVSKGARGGLTTADISVLGGSDRVAEIARMLGGDPDSEVSRAHAKELLATSAGR